MSELYSRGIIDVFPAFAKNMFPIYKIHDHDHCAISNFMKHKYGILGRGEVVIGVVPSFAKTLTLAFFRLCLGDL